eukprot:1815796-Rhodomonas_salina.3
MPPFIFKHFRDRGSRWSEAREEGPKESKGSAEPAGNGELIGVVIIASFRRAAMGRSSSQSSIFSAGLHRVVSRKRSKWGEALPLLLACITMVGLPAFSATVSAKKSSVVIHVAGETIDTSEVASLKPKSFLSLSWMVGILGAASGLAAPNSPVSKQWYVVLEDGAKIQQLGQESGIAFGMTVAQVSCPICLRDGCPRLTQRMVFSEYICCDRE